MRSPVRIRLWARSWWLVGNGPSYLLFRAQERRVMHLTEQLPRNLREALKGYQAVKNGTLVPLVRALSLINTNALTSSKQTESSIRCKKAGVEILATLEYLIYNSFPSEKSFEEALARFTSCVRATRRLTEVEHEFAGGPEFPISIDKERSKYWISDSYGRELLIGDDTTIAGSQCTFRCVTHSRIARTTQTLWDREQQNFGSTATCLYRVPTRKELREELLLDEPAVTKLCRAEGFDWLPKASFRKRRKRCDRNAKAAVINAR
jgi:hypothetical protein